MKKISVIYWSGTGNTKLMAEAIAEGAKSAGGEVKLLEVADAAAEDVLNADTVALGCPSMGCEVLEEGEMEPFICELEKNGLSNKQMVLFGSYDWGDGQWMRDWSERMSKAGAVLVEGELIVRNTPDAAVLLDCRGFGIRLAGM